MASAFDAVRLIVASAFDAMRLIVASAFDAMRQRLLDSMPLGVPVPLPLPLVGLTLVCVRLLPAYQLPAIRSQCARVGQKPARNKTLSSQAVAESRHVDSRVCLLTQKREDSALLMARVQGLSGFIQGSGAGFRFRVQGRNAGLGFRVGVQGWGSGLGLGVGIQCR